MKNEWDEYADGWDTNADVIEYAGHAFDSLSNVMTINGLRVLDFGCGTGLLTEKLSPLAKEIVAIDPSGAMTKVLVQKALPNVQVINDFLTADLIASDASLQQKFDLIVASSVCGFLPDYPGTLALLKSLLAEEGKFVQWDWLGNEEDPESGLTKKDIINAFQLAQLELDHLSEPFSMISEKGSFPVVMGVGRCASISPDNV